MTLHTIRLFQGDYAELQSLYGGAVSANKIIRILVRQTIRKIKETASKGFKSVSVDLEIDPDDREAPDSEPESIGRSEPSEHADALLNGPSSNDR